ncbi:MAG: BadF/BadG/BcrA/BcrD ATPase family protein [Candidatus Poribacteria bacterium]
MNYILGIDGGGTKTLAACADIDGNILGVGMSGGSNYHTVGLEKAIDAIKQAIEQAILKANINKSDISIAYMGLSGAGREKDQIILTQAINNLAIADEIIVKHDAFIALAGATACKPGVIVIAGTGSMAFGVNQFNQESRSNGWGSILGDEGSAYYISQKALISTCRAYDGRGEKTALLEAIKRHFGLDDFSEIIYKVYGSSAQDIASLAPLVSQSADLGDEIAIEILKDAGRELALSAIAVIKNLCMDEPIQVTTAGSVFSAGKILVTSFEETLKSYNPYVEIINPKFKPVVGALLLALREKRIKIDKKILGMVHFPF